MHASLLPRWRGAAPIARAIEAGDRTTGITIMQMDAGLDTGPMLLTQAIDISPDDTAATLTARLADLGAALLVQSLREVQTLVAQPQPAEGATYAAKIEKAEAWLDWSAAAAALARKVRAFDPFPVALARIGATPIKIWRAESSRDGRCGGAGNDRRDRSPRHRRGMRRRLPSARRTAAAGREASAGARIPRRVSR